MQYMRLCLTSSSSPASTLWAELMSRVRHGRGFEPPRLSRRVHNLRGWVHGCAGHVSVGGSGAGRAAGVRAAGRPRLAVGDDRERRREDRLRRRDLAQVVRAAERLQDPAEQAVDADRRRTKALEPKNRELKQANEILRTTPSSERVWAPVTAGDRRRISPADPLWCCRKPADAHDTLTCDDRLAAGQEDAARRVRPITHRPHQPHDDVRGGVDAVRRRPWHR